MTEMVSLLMFMFVLCIFLFKEQSNISLGFNRWVYRNMVERPMVYIKRKFTIMARIFKQKSIHNLKLTVKYILRFFWFIFLFGVSLVCSVLSWLWGLLRPPLLVLQRYIGEQIQRLALLVWGNVVAGWVWLKKALA